MTTSSCSSTSLDLALVGDHHQGAGKDVMDAAPAPMEDAPEQVEATKQVDRPCQPTNQHLDATQRPPVRADDGQPRYRFAGGDQPTLGAPEAQVVDELRQVAERGGRQRADGEREEGGADAEDGGVNQQCQEARQQGRDDDDFLRRVR